ncbi:MAG: hypothetical protein AB8B62_10535 [Roseobacter sp.]
MIRPEAKAQLVRFREVLAGVGAALLGLWWLWGASPLLMLPGVALALAGIALIWLGLQRAKFRGEGLGPGSVQVDEGQITYFGPLTGGAVDLRDLTQITFDGTLFPAHWQLHQPGVPDLLIPRNAEGSERLFDAFATLPGFRMQSALSVLGSDEKHSIVIWQRTPVARASIALH